MNVNVNVNMDVQKILRTYGLGSSDKTRKFLAADVKRRCDKYVPFDTGTLKNTAQVSGDGRSIVYPQSYAAKQYENPYGHSDPLRGDHWDSRMMANEQGQLTADMDAYVKGRPGK